MSTSKPQRRTTIEPSRLFALGGAGVVTALAVGGALGLIPGVAVQSYASGSADAVTSAGSDASSEATDDSGGAISDDGWLTVDDGPGSDEGAGETVSGEGDAAGTGASTDEPSSQPDYSLPGESGAGKRIVYDISAQHVWLVSADNEVMRHYPVSGGRDESLLQPGRYDVYSKSRHAVSYNLRETMNYMVRFSHGESAPIGFHDVPTSPDGRLVQTRAALGSARSAGCIRQWSTDARALWRFSEVGSSVVVKA